MTDQSPDMGIPTASTLGTPRDLRARVVLAVISASPAKPQPSAGRAAALVEEARTIMAFITSDAGPDEPPADAQAGSPAES